ncbi:hypothetical protein JIX56_25125 [Streptomyces sp. CA-210063]|uniref:hypothetical protein n=1 Tax=Streptomyces sp. CA-210063 TaxID=2801029 RepID=UPI00214AC885|nr:hypothetical protein [Streptomyces sp. CA-210063]UUU32892.1 hypothetical protein JIX56_25125 [Streptomyces sp. CA-210063]
MTDDGFMGPPWQMDWTLKAQAVRDSLPEQVRKMVDDARAELVTAKDPYSAASTPMRIFLRA